MTSARGRRIARAGLGYVLEDCRVFGDLTVMENLDTGRQLPRKGAPTWTPEKRFSVFPNLGEMRERRASRMSGGEQQMLTVSRTLMGNPRVVLLDEPSECVAPVIVDQMADMILKLKQEGLSILLSEQNLHFAERVSDRIYVLEKGQIGHNERFSARRYRATRVSWHMNSSNKGALSMIRHAGLRLTLTAVTAALSFAAHADTITIGRDQQLQGRARIPDALQERLESGAGSDQCGERHQRQQAQSRFAR